MEEEFEPVKKVEEEVKIEPKEEHVEVKPIPPEVIDNNKPPRHIGRLIGRLIWFLVFIVLIAEIVLGFLNTQKINDNKEPIWCIDYKVEKDKTSCHLGLYVIIKTKEGNETTTSLKPFFLN